MRRDMIVKARAILAANAIPSAPCTAAEAESHNKFFRDIGQPEFADMREGDGVYLVVASR